MMLRQNDVRCAQVRHCQPHYQVRQSDQRRLFAGERADPGWKHRLTLSGQDEKQRVAERELRLEVA